MKKIFWIPVLAVSIGALCSCDKYDDLNNPGGNKSVENTFKTMYAGVNHVEWEKEGNYWKADFWKDGREMEAWFTLDGQWYQTITDITFAELPEAVKAAFLAGEYGGWRVDDVDMFERKDSPTFYVLDVESGNRDYNLYYSLDGTLIKAVRD